MLFLPWGTDTSSAYVDQTEIQVSIWTFALLQLTWYKKQTCAFLVYDENCSCLSTPAYYQLSLLMYKRSGQTALHGPLMSAPMICSILNWVTASGSHCSCTGSSLHRSCKTCVNTVRNYCRYYLHSRRRNSSAGPKQICTSGSGYKKRTSTWWSRKNKITETACTQGKPRFHFVFAGSPGSWSGCVLDIAAAWN